MKQKCPGEVRIERWEAMELLSVGRVSRETGVRGEFSLLKAISLSFDIGSAVSKSKRLWETGEINLHHAPKSSTYPSQELSSKTSQPLLTPSRITSSLTPSTKAPSNISSPLQQLIQNLYLENATGISLPQLALHHYPGLSHLQSLSLSVGPPKSRFSVMVFLLRRKLGTAGICETNNR